MNSSLPTRGLVLRGHARYYDLVIRMMSLVYGRSHVRALLDVAALEPSEHVLDIGCGTGALALAAARELRAEDRQVHGIDASEQMIAVARRKSAKAHHPVRFSVGTAEALPFVDGQFGVVFSTLMLHHLPKPARENCLREARRVLKPTGRALVCDFEAPAGKRRGLLAHMHRHGGVPVHEVKLLLERSGFVVASSGALDVSDLHFSIAHPV